MKNTNGKLAVKNGAAKLEVRYNLDSYGVFKGDTFNIRVVDELNLLTNDERIRLLNHGIETLLERFPNFELENAAHVASFVAETRGHGVVWFSRKQTA